VTAALAVQRHERLHDASPAEHAQHRGAPHLLFPRQSRESNLNEVGIVLNPAKVAPAIEVEVLPRIALRPSMVVAREPHLIIGSWRGKKFRPERVMARPGFERTPAMQHQDVYEIKSPRAKKPTAAINRS
jgi:hypothetical protein